MSDWRPSADIQTLKQRAAFLQNVRAFFAARNVWEVETPQLSKSAVTDPHLHSFKTTFLHPLQPAVMPLYLQTSPEYAMKRLLCAGSGAIFQISRAFRNEEGGRLHNPEFSMLEWYRPGFDHHQLMDEVDELVQTLLHCEPAERISYQQVFIEHLGLDPLACDDLKLVEVGRQHGFDEVLLQSDRDTLLQLLFSHIIEPNIGLQRPCLVHLFPASQAALARIDAHDLRVARRFELYFKGLELANGFHELADPEEQLQRFQLDNKKRKQIGLTEMPIDQNLINALTCGLPDCSGVAMGLDRLMMLAFGKDSIARVMAFSIDNA